LPYIVTEYGRFLKRRAISGKTEYDDDRRSPVVDMLTASATGDSWRIQEFRPLPKGARAPRVGIIRSTSFTPSSVKEIVNWRPWPPTTRAVRWLLSTVDRFGS
jgi:hypothetical protein